MLTGTNYSSRQRHLHSKRLASQSPAALAEILGVPVSSLPATPTESPAASGASTPAAKESSPETTDAAESDGEPKRDSLETISTSKMSVSDYFRQKLREKALARQAASGSSTPAPTLSAGSLAVMEDVKITQDGVGWEGTKMKFEEVETELADLGPEYERPGEKPASDSSSDSTESEEPKEKKKSKGKEKASDDDKAAKKARKEEKRAKKEEKEEKRRRKEEKKAAKAEKEAKKEGKDKKDKKRKRDEDGDSDGKKRKSKKD